MAKQRQAGVNNIRNLERILSILSQLDYLMFRGGSGGEFISSLIFKYSNTYKNPDVLSSYQNEVNKTEIHYPHFFGVICNLPQQNANLTEYFGNTSDEDLIEAEEFLTKYPRFLIRTHYTNHQLLLDNTFFLLLDEERWFEYAGLLAALKNQCSIADIPYIFNFRNFKLNKRLSDEELLKTKIVESMQQNGLEKISIFQSDILHSSLASIDEVINTSIPMLYQKYKYAIHGDYETYVNAMKRKNVKKIINFSNIFNKGYLEDIFDVTDPSFHEGLMNWHEKNLNLLQENGIDVSRFR